MWNPLTEEDEPEAPSFSFYSDPLASFAPSQLKHTVSRQHGGFRSHAAAPSHSMQAHAGGGGGASPLDGAPAMRRPYQRRDYSTPGLTDNSNEDERPAAGLSGVEGGHHGPSVVEPPSSNEEPSTIPSRSLLPFSGKGSLGPRPSLSAPGIVASQGPQGTTSIIPPAPPIPPYPMPPTNPPPHHFHAETSSPSGPLHQPQLHSISQTPSVGGNLWRPSYDERGHMRGPDELPMSFGKTGRGGHPGRGQGYGQQYGGRGDGGGGAWNGGRGGDFGRGRGRSFPHSKGDEQQGGGGGFMGRFYKPSMSSDPWAPLQRDQQRPPQQVTNGGEGGADGFRLPSGGHVGVNSAPDPSAASVVADGLLLQQQHHQLVDQAAARSQQQVAPEPQQSLADLLDSSLQEAAEGEARDAFTVREVDGIAWKGDDEGVADRPWH